MSGTEVSGASGASYGDLLVTALVVLVGACVVMFVIVRVAARWLGGGRSRRAELLDVVARVPLEARRSLYIVDVAGKALLLGTSELGVAVLSELDRDLVRAAPPPATFVDLVRGAMARAGGRRRREGEGDGGSP
jgi:flagellar biogenesis protein FliO